MKQQYSTISLLLLTLLFFLSCGSKDPIDCWGQNKHKDEQENNKETENKTDKPRYIWIDAAANFPDFANSKEAITRDLTLAKDAGFTDIVVDVRPTCGDVLFKTSMVEQVKYQYAWTSTGYTKIDRTATWDYLQAFIDAARKLDLKVHAAINTFVGGNTMNNGTGMVYRDESKRAWTTQMSTAQGIVSIMDEAEPTKFLNPANPEVQTFLCNLLRDLAKYDLDGIVLDRGRYLDLRADFSDLSRKKFETYMGSKISNFPEDILPKGARELSGKSSDYTKKWLEFRAKTIRDFMEKARNAVKSVNSKIQFGVYVGGWYTTYYTVGVNWGSPNFKTSDYYRWATKNYHSCGYADLMDQMLIGAYASPLRVYGNTEWTMQGFCQQAMSKIKGACPKVVGGPDVGNWDTTNKATQEQENQAIVQSVKACMDACNGYFLFDMIHLKKANQWKYAKEGIAKAIEKTNQ
ncbi:glycosyl hydrolase-like domain protein, PF02638 family [Prevotella sp. BV3P1]|uniref:alpha amylase family protein n=1 Tax=Prevotellaceae TaxID=171552 RepID=UPI0003B8C0D7|nr:MULTISPECIES: alpha amylase family protein [Prevotellaceae]ERT61154.1 glycosyl hydrolase-like domain protein, PF02638 family [Prevotella sp. BV3P1]KGF42702.1 S-layer protein [Hoylesella buccalis DNF00985]